MAGNAEHLFNCSDCDIKGKDRDQKEINHLYTVRVGNSIRWLNRCRACWKVALCSTEGVEPTP